MKCPQAHAYKVMNIWASADAKEILLPIIESHDKGKTEDRSMKNIDEENSTTFN
jgi:hypothetical protein